MRPSIDPRSTAISVVGHPGSAVDEEVVDAGQPGEVETVGAAPHDGPAGRGAPTVSRVLTAADVGRYRLVAFTWVMLLSHDWGRG